MMHRPACYLLLSLLILGCASGGDEGAGSGTSAGGSSSSGSATGGAGGEGCLQPTCDADGKTILCDGMPIGSCEDGEFCDGGQCFADACSVVGDDKSSNGCAFYALHTDPSQYYTGNCFAAFVANTWTGAVDIAVEREGSMLPIEAIAAIPVGTGSALVYEPYAAATGLPPGEVAILFLGGDCPMLSSPVDPGVVGTGYGQAYRITTSAPVVAYQEYPFGDGTAAYNSATLLLPTVTWDTNYIAISAYPVNQHPLETPENQSGPTLAILAGEDDTEVTILPVAPILAGGGVPASAANQPATYMLARGQYLQLTQQQELTGSPIVSNKPVAVFGGHECMLVPSDTGPCDTAHQQIPPIKALGSEYVAVRYEGRNGQNETVPWRLVGAVDGTALTYVPATPAGAPTTLSQGQVVEFWSTGPFVVRSQDADHPFYLGAYMTAASYGDFVGQGDPEWLNVVPSSQLLDDYVFFTDPTYPATHIVVVRKKPASGPFADVELDCAGTLGGWQPIGADYEYTRRDMVSGGCQNGRHTASSEAPFGITVWGWAQTSSYGYPAGAAVNSVNDVELPIPK
jgi:hypothetical protein